MVDMTQTRDLRKARATETELAIERLIEAVNNIAKNQKKIAEALSKLITTVDDNKKYELETIYGLFPKIVAIEDSAVDDVDRKELLRQYGNGGKILETEHTYLDTEADYDTE